MSEKRANVYAIRASTPNEHHAVGALLKSCYPVLMKPHYSPSVLKAALPLMTLANPALLDSGSFFVAERTNGDIVGCGGWTRERPGNGEVVEQLGHIRHFATDPEYIGLGIGRSLYNTCVQQAREAGISRFEFYAFSRDWKKSA